MANNRQRTYGAYIHLHYILAYIILTYIYIHTHIYVYIQCIYIYIINIYIYIFIYTIIITADHQYCAQYLEICNLKSGVSA